MIAARWRMHGGIAHSGLKDNSAFLCLAKMLVAVIRTTI